MDYQNAPAEHVPPTWAKVALAIVVCVTVVGILATGLALWLLSILEEMEHFD